ncbi:hypothetical protein PROFUN_16734 [Planoprotostelium fungivorum]|uniref:Uncharacterized protein n=1 Tax=Planoprotostelium fungivorum TaxID=1890364 RepID=A0A2P6MPJ8_9EUKA|nr:hypothetical protein PROFUN_16734 [Planoprotostelium fungivorum]
MQCKTITLARRAFSTSTPPPQEIIQKTNSFMRWMKEQDGWKAVGAGLTILGFGTASIHYVASSAADKALLGYHTQMTGDIKNLHTQMTGDIKNLHTQMMGDLKHMEERMEDRIGKLEEKMDNKLEKIDERLRQVEMTTETQDTRPTHKPLLVSASMRHRLLSFTYKCFAENLQTDHRRQAFSV